ncbi:MAG TPA: hypothetical protein VGK19_07770 [Capsulimonadaceae bacterium]|jgi:hypothetical protein
MNEERMMVLRMVHGGKLTPEQADGLLDAIEGDSYAYPPIHVSISCVINITLGGRTNE